MGSPPSDTEPGSSTSAWLEDILDFIPPKSLWLEQNYTLVFNYCHCSTHSSGPFMLPRKSARGLFAMNDDICALVRS